MGTTKTMKISELRRELLHHDDDEIVSVAFHKFNAAAGFGIISTSSMRREMEMEIERNKVAPLKRIGIKGIIKPNKY